MPRFELHEILSVIKSLLMVCVISIPLINYVQFKYFEEGYFNWVVGMIMLYYLGITMLIYFCWIVLKIIAFRSKKFKRNKFISAMNIYVVLVPLSFFL